MPVEPRNGCYDEAAFSNRHLGHAYSRRNVLRIYKYMAGGLAISGATAAFVLYSGLYAAVAGTYLMWALLLAPIPIGLMLEFQLARVSVGTDRVRVLELCDPVRPFAHDSFHAGDRDQYC